MEIANTAIPTFPQHDCDDFVFQVCWQKKLMAETVQNPPPSKPVPSDGP